LFENKLLTDFKNAIKADSRTVNSYLEFKQRVKTEPDLKVTQKMKDEITTALSDNTGELYKFFKNRDQNTLYIATQDSLYNLIEQSKEGKAYYKEVFFQAKDKFTDKTQAAQAPPQAAPQLPFGTTFISQAETAPPSTSAAESDSTTSSAKLNKPDLDNLGAPLNHTPDTSQKPLYNPFLSGMPSKKGGKSSRRHRRGRTLHKRRKSSKVRKTRYRRTHSRTRR
jgi:hypothetical protein